MPLVVNDLPSETIFWSVVELPLGALSTFLMLELEPDSLDEERSTRFSGSLLEEDRLGRDCEAMALPGCC